MSTLSLREFSDAQIAFIEEAARKAWRLLELKPTFDMERWFTDARHRLPYLRGVSFREFAAEVLTPGTFRRCGR